uniref:Grass carp reovirus (GCRV)-induced gene 2j n=1 Tax=Oryzias latipes TaxID=8090 RepID=A0A3P9HJ27_ORYLA
MSGIQFQWLESSVLLPGLFHLDTPQPNDGRTYVMYHGTTRANAEKIKANGFQRSTCGMLGAGVYLSRDLEKARRYPINHPDKDRVIIKVKVNVGRVIVIRHQNHRLQKTWSSHGYDSAWVPPNCGMVNSGLEENCIWDPKARRYPIDHPDEDRIIIKVKVNVGRVIVISKQNHSLQKTWSSHGFDSAWVPPNCGMVRSGLEENCIWDPCRIHILDLIKPQLLPFQPYPDE